MEEFRILIHINIGVHSDEEAERVHYDVKSMIEEYAKTYNFDAHVSDFDTI